MATTNNSTSAEDTYTLKRGQRRLNTTQLSAVDAISVAPTTDSATLQGPPGPTGEAGSRWILTDRDPDAMDGKLNDCFLNTSTKEIFYKDTATSWTSRGKLSVDSTKITKSDIGLSNVDNTPDLLKPVSDSTRRALNDKEDAIPKTSTGYAKWNGNKWEFVTDPTTYQVYKKFVVNNYKLEWTIRHNLGTDRFTPTLRDHTGTQFYARVQTIDDNSFKVILASSMMGSVDVVFDTTPKQLYDLVDVVA